MAKERWIVPGEEAARWMGQCAHAPLGAVAGIPELELLAGKNDEFGETIGKSGCRKFRDREVEAFLCVEFADNLISAIILR